MDTPDLSAVKAEVKVWERTFRSKEGRLPTKDDIKKDPGRIGERYALYRNLSKMARESQGMHPTASSSTSSFPAAEAGPSSRATPRTRSTNGLPTTPTPTSRTSRPDIDSSSPSDKSAKALASGLNEMKTLKRTASVAVLGSPTSTGRLFVTPKKPRPTYGGPIHDPNPINPFAISPSKSTPGDSVSTALPSQSPFLHASSPRKLRELLSENSLKKVKDRASGSGRVEDVTPRTKARMRLAGEVADTPIKEKTLRRRGRGKQKQLAAIRWSGEDIPGRDESEGDDGYDFGPSPMKHNTTIARSFTELLRPNGTKSVLAKSRKKETTKQLRDTSEGHTDIRMMFSGIRRGEDNKKDPQNEQGQVAIAPAITGDNNPSLLAMSMDKDVASGMSPPAASPKAELSIQPFGFDIEAPPIPRPSPMARPTKALALSDGEEDEWNPEGVHQRHRVTITGTRRIVTRQIDSDDYCDELSDDTEAHSGSEPVPGGQEERPPTLYDGTTATSPSSPSSTINVLRASNTPLLELLSLRSPRNRHSEIHDLRVKAIFNPGDAARLKALTRGQAVFGSGQAIDDDDEGEEAIMEHFGFGITDETKGADCDGGNEDDDWEEECEGWKRSQVDEEQW